MTANDSKYYLSYLNKLIDQFNNTYHHSIGKKLVNADYSDLTKKIETNPKASIFKVNDRVRITKLKNIKMKNNEVWKVRIKSRKCYYFNDMIEFEDFDFDNILIAEKPHEGILIHDISDKTSIDPNALRIRFHKIDEFVTAYDRTRYLILFDPEECDAISNRIKYK